MWQVADTQLALPDASWRKSARSGKQGNCVELAAVPRARVAVRNSRFPSGPALVFPTAAVAALIADIKGGDLDHLLGEGLPS